MACLCRFGRRETRETDRILIHVILLSLLFYYVGTGTRVHTLFICRFPVHHCVANYINVVHEHLIPDQ